MAPGKYLNGVVVATTGTFPGHTVKSIVSSVTNAGGKTSTTINSSCTHLIATAKEWDKAGTKVQAALDITSVDVVSLDWLLDSLDQKRNLDTDNYLFDQAQSRPTTPQLTDNHANVSTTPNSQIRGLIDLTDTDDQATPAQQHVGKKRARQDEPDSTPSRFGQGNSEERASKKQKDGQKAKSGSLHVPVDSDSFASTHRVYIATHGDPTDSGTIMDATLNQTNVNQNNNKYYRIQLIAHSSREEYIVTTRWGRVGEGGQRKDLDCHNLGHAFSQFEKKFKDKTGYAWADRTKPSKKGKYTYLERNYEESSDEEEDEEELPGAGTRRGSKTSLASPSKKSAVECTLPKPVQRLLEMIFNQQYFAATLHELSYDANKLPLGKLSKRTLNAGFECLRTLAEVVNDPATAMERHGMTPHDAIENFTNQFYTTIPHDFRRNRPPMISNPDMIKKEVDLLEALTDMEIAAEIMKDATTQDADGSLVHPLDRHYRGLNLSEMTPLGHNTNEFNELQSYLTLLRGSTHYLNYKVQDIFRIERAGEIERFQKSHFGSLRSSDRRLLWHGSRSTNFGGILSQGLRIAPPEAPPSGYMFGKGVYLADISSKSANYCFSDTSGSIGLLLLCEAELGKPMLELKHADYDAGEKAKQNGSWTTHGQGIDIPVGWKDAGCVHKNLRGIMMPDASKGQVTAPNSRSLQLQYNEYIAYDVAQIRLRYLFRVEMKPSHY